MYGFVWVASDLTYSSLKVKNIIEGQEVYVLSGTSFLSPMSLRHLMSSELVLGPAWLVVIEILGGDCQKCSVLSPPPRRRSE